MEKNWNNNGGQHSSPIMDAIGGVFVIIIVYVAAGLLGCFFRFMITGNFNSTSPSFDEMPTEQQMQEAIEEAEERDLYNQMNE